MSTPDLDHRPASHDSSGPRWPVKTALLMVAVGGGFFLLREQWDPVAGNWIYLLLLACPLMHLFHGHGGHGGDGRHGSQPKRPGRQGALKP